MTATGLIRCRHHVLASFESSRCPVRRVLRGGPAHFEYFTILKGKFMDQGNAASLDKWTTLSTPDIYFTKEYHEVSAHIEADFADYVLLEWQDNNGVVYLPLVLREIPKCGYFDATNAYGYGGPWVEGAPNLEGFRRFMDDWMVDHKVVDTFIQFHPLFDYAAVFADVLPLNKAGQTVVWNFETDDLIAQMASGHRRNWRKAIRAGLEVQVTPHPADLTEFRHLYELSMQRLNTRSFYFFPDAYWEGLQEHLRDKLVQIDAVYEGRVVASCLNFLGPDYVHFHLNGATDEGRELRGPFVAHVGGALWAQEHGFSHGNLGVTPAGSLLEFKDRFDPATPHRDFYVARIVHDRPNFQKLSAGLPETRYFPPWRDPAVSRVSAGG